jgi:hypothetical protein
MLNELTEETFLETMSDDMEDVTETTDDTLDIWPYAAELAKAGLISNDVVRDKDIAIVYRDGDAIYEHILLPTADEDTFITIVINLEAEILMGHYKLVLGPEAGE